MMQSRKMIKVENQPSLIRDTTNKAILSNDVAAFNAHMTQRSRMEKIDVMENRITSIEEKLDLLIRLLDK
jgi:phage shock protein A